MAELSRQPDSPNGHRKLEGSARACEDVALRQELTSLLIRTDRILKNAIQSATGVAPELEVVDQWRLSPPIPASLAPPLSPESEILGRCTSYRVDGVPLSWNLAYVDLGRVDATLAAQLESKRRNLGDLFGDPRIHRMDYASGTEKNAGELDEALHSRLPESFTGLETYLWRRYVAAMSGVITFVVIEALPVASWSDYWAERGRRERGEMSRPGGRT
jgi:hypothetical protein